jgi:hypothetical protein
MFKKLKRAAKSVGKAVETNVRGVADVAKSNAKAAGQAARGDFSGAMKQAVQSVKTGASAAKSSAKASGMANAMRRSKSVKSSDMPMGQLDKMRGERGMVGSIPGMMKFAEDDK